MTPLRDRLERDGFAIVPGVLAPETVASLLDALAVIASRSTNDERRTTNEEGAVLVVGRWSFVGDPSVRRRDEVYAIRNLARIVPLVAEVAASASVRVLAVAALGSGASAVQALFLDKPPDANWKITRHRDRTYPVRARVDVPGFGPWSVKAGVPHVQMPDAVLARLLIVRLHLDDCTTKNGPLRVIPGSHRHGARRTELSEETTCLVPRGGALLMRPLLLHASSASRTPGHRRVIHLVYAAEPLPGGLEWPTIGP